MDLAPDPDQTVIAIHDAPGIYKGEVSTASAARPLTITIADLVALLGAEIDFILLWLLRARRISKPRLRSNLSKESINLMATIPPHTRLKDVENAANLMALVQDNFEVLAGETAKRDPTYQNGIPTTVIGPPTTGDHVIDEFWRDALGVGLHCRRDSWDVEADSPCGGDGRSSVRNDTDGVF